MMRIQGLASVLAAAWLLGIGGCGDIQAIPEQAPDAGVQPPPVPEPELRAVMPSVGSSDGRTLVAITGQHFLPGMLVTFDGLPATDLTVHSPSTITALTPAHAAGVVTVRLLGRGGEVVELEDAYEYIAATPIETPDTERPRVVGAVSIGNTRVRVSFSEPVESGAEDASSYGIVQANVNSESGALAVRAAELDDSGLNVTLTTASQSELTYLLRVTQVRDRAGNPLAAAELLVDPTIAEFAGTPASAEDGTLVDSDEDGLTDDFEQNGWTVTVALANGDFTQSTRTSDPTRADTDGDGLSDAEELTAGSNPRAVDTDGDGVSDAVEWNEWFSDPAMQDSDGDGLSDGIEIAFETSAILDDTDGDGESDTSELLLLSRDPLIANLPVPQIVVQGIRLELDVTSSYTDETGQTVSVSDSTATQFTQSRSQVSSRSDTRSTESSNTNSQEIGAEVSYGVKDGWGGKVSGKAGFEQSRARGFSSTVESQQASESQQSYERSVSNALESSERRSVTRSIERAAIIANVNLANQSDVAFTITNLELSVQSQDRAGDGSFRPVATLRPSGGGELAFNLGPFDAERGPVIFENTDIFPNLVEGLMREPSGLVFKVANYDVLDEEGRNFAFSSAITNQRTVGISIDFGDGNVESYRIATHSRFDGRGRPVGITMERALQIAGIARTANDEPLPSPVPEASLHSYGTLEDASGVERLVRMRGVQNDLLSPTDPEKRFWAIQTNNTQLATESDFSSLVLHGGDEFLFYFTRDVDQDGLHEREEALYGSLDNRTDTDSDGLDDYEEVREGWTVAPLPGQVYKVFPSPSRPDSDLDGLRDDEERLRGTDPNRSDTDTDALSDDEELSGSYLIALFDGDPDDTNNPRLLVEPYSDDAIVDGIDGVCDTTAQGDDVQVAAVGATVTAGDLLIDAGPNGVIDTTPAGDDVQALLPNIAAGPDGACATTALGDDIAVSVPGGNTASNTVCVRAGANGTLDSLAEDDDFVRVVHEALFSTHPTRRDTDFDGIPDGRELLIGTNPNTQDFGNITDTDNDGLFDAEEDNGWYVAAQGAVVRSNKLFADSDQDGLLDVFEWAIGSNPVRVDTDGDTLRDGNEFDPDDTDAYYSASNLATAEARCAAATNCNPAAPPNLSERPRTNVLAIDSDSDTLRDDWEIAAGQPGNSLWVVTVVGSNTPPYAGAPKPWAADFDGDALNDAAEYAQRTDPNLADTDADNLAGLNGNDGYEVSVGRNPLQADQEVTFRYLNLLVNNICGDAGASAEWYGTLYVTDPVNGDSAEYTCSNCCQVDMSGSCGINRSQTFRLITGQSFSVRSSQWSESDSSSGDDDVGSFSDSFSYPVSATASSQLDLTGGADCSNSLSVTYSITLR